MAYGGVAAAAQVAVAILAIRHGARGIPKGIVVLLFALNAMVAAVWAARAWHGFTSAAPLPILLERLGALFDGPTTFLVLALAIHLRGRWRPWMGPALLVAWVPHAAWLALGKPWPDWPVDALYTTLMVRLSYAAVVAACILAWKDPDWRGSAAPWLLGAFGIRAVELAVLDLRTIGTSFPDASGAVTTGVPSVILLAVCCVAAGWALREMRRDSTAAVALIVFLSGLAFGAADWAARSAADLVAPSYLSVFSLFILRPVVAGPGVLARPLAFAPMFVVAGGILAAGAYVLSAWTFAGLDPLTHLALALGAATPLTYAAWRAFASRIPNPQPERLGERARRTHSILQSRPLASPAPALVEALRRAPAPVRIYAALQGSAAKSALYAEEFSHAGLCALAGVHYKKLSGVLRRMEAEQETGALDGADPLVVEYGVGRTKYYRLSPRGMSVASGTLARHGLGGWDAEALRAGLLQRSAVPGRGAAPAEASRARLREDDVAFQDDVVSP